MIRSLPNAVKAAIAHGNKITNIKPAFWAATYHCSEEDVRKAWELELTRQSLTPVGYEVEGK